MSHCGMGHVYGNIIIYHLVRSRIFGMKRNEKYLIVLLIIYFSLFVSKKMEFYFPIISDYFSDLICIPLSLLFIQWLSKRMTGQNMEIGFMHVLIAVLCFSLVFEVWMPSVSENYTADILDVICYSVGGMIYLLFFKKEIIPITTIK